MLLFCFWVQVLFQLFLCIYRLKPPFTRVSLIGHVVLTETSPYTPPSDWRHDWCVFMIVSEVNLVCPLWHWLCVVRREESFSLKWSEPGFFSSFLCPNEEGADQVRLKPTSFHFDGILLITCSGVDVCCFSPLCAPPVSLRLQLMCTTPSTSLVKCHSHQMYTTNHERVLQPFSYNDLNVGQTETGF